MSFVYVVIAGLFEMLGVLSMNKVNKDRSWRSYLLLIGAFSLSFLFLSFAMKSMPMGTAYAIWTGIGAAGGTILGMVFYGEPKNVLRIVCIAMILGAAIGLKLVE
ncbi:paired small multidrug resistance pump [Paenibacillus turicensis]|uniref:Paired small multidrug resistance pump n=1 Tax=Paenibacillus turicensis TaxID=160487 RepID=A0ABS4FTH9_9BACL|nr:paired small multidrug resistance pump [Paenibacillus turicensis]